MIALVRVVAGTTTIILFILTSFLINTQTTINGGTTVAKKDTATYDDLLKATETMTAEGFEGMDADTVALPFLRVLQDLSPACKKRDADYIEGAEPGMFYNTATEELIEGPLKVVIGRFDRTFLEWKPDRKGLGGVHTPEAVGLRKDLILNDKNQLMNPATGNLFADTYTYYVVFPDRMDMGICLLSLASTQLKTAKKLNRTLTSTMIPGSTKKAMPYFMIFNMSTVMESNDQGDWFGSRFKLDAFVDQLMLDNVVESRETMITATANYAQLEDKTGETEVLDDDEPGPNEETNKKF